MRRLSLFVVSCETVFRNAGWWRRTCGRPELRPVGLHFSRWECAITEGAGPRADGARAIRSGRPRRRPGPGCISGSTADSNLRRIPKGQFGCHAFHDCWSALESASIFRRRVGADPCIPRTYGAARGPQSADTKDDQMISVRPAEGVRDGSRSSIAARRGRSIRFGVGDGTRRSEDRSETGLVAASRKKVSR